MEVECDMACVRSRLGLSISRIFQVYVMHEVYLLWSLGHNPCSQILGPVYMEPSYPASRVTRQIEFPGNYGNSIKCLYETGG